MESKRIAGTILTLSFRACVMVLVVLFTILFANRSYTFGLAIFQETTVSASTGQPVVKVSVTIPEGISDMDIAKTMEAYGLVEDHWLFFAQITLSDHKQGSKAEPILPGTYELSTGMTPSEMMKIMSTPVAADEEKK